jgi:molecular chaperone GrpE
MTKPKDQPLNDQPIPEETTAQDQTQSGAQASNESRTEVHVETSSSQSASSQFASSDAQSGSDDAGDERVQELTADLQRLQAEFMNYKRRAEAERAEVLDFAKNRIVREFLTVRDSFDQEQAHRPATADATWAKSIDAIRLQFDQVLKALGVERFESQGQPFDPHLHEAVAMEDGEGDHEVVAEELQAGYKLGATILRHAIVKVGKTAGPAPAADEPAQDAEAK